MRSSYSQHNYGDVLYSTLLAYPPKIAVELGILDGYSTFWIGRALQRNVELMQQLGHLDAYDLFEDYPYQHGEQQRIQDRLVRKGVEEYVTLFKGDAFQVHEKYAENSVTFLHIDISNTGEIVRRLVDSWHPKMQVGGIIAIEGGTEERDNTAWMKKYHKTPIKPEIEANPILNASYVYATYLNFPGLTICLRKR